MRTMYIAQWHYTALPADSNRGPHGQCQWSYIHHGYRADWDFRKDRRSDRPKVQVA